MSFGKMSFGKLSLTVRQDIKDGLCETSEVPLGWVKVADQEHRIICGF
jgi:hypothetical protein